MSDKKMKRDDLGNRMKTFYEGIPKTRLMRRKISKIEQKNYFG